MARRKTQKSEKIVDLKPKAEKISEKQLTKVQDVINRINRGQLELGIMETRKHSILHSIARVQDELTLLQEEFKKEYGTYDVNIQDGSINYPENGEVNKKD